VIAALVPAKHAKHSNRPIGRALAASSPRIGPDRPYEPFPSDLALILHEEMG
jgi:hypothetical protein